MRELSFSAFWGIGFELLGVGLPLLLAVAAIVIIAVIAGLLRFGSRLNAKDWFKAALIGAVMGIAGLLAAILLTSAAVTDLRVSTDYLAAAILVLGLGTGVTAMAGAIFGLRRARTSTIT